MDSYEEESNDNLSGDEGLNPEDFFENDGEENFQFLNNSDDRDENEAEKKQKDGSESKAAKRRIVRNPRVLLNADRLMSANGIPSLIETFDKFKFRGKYHEKEDLTEIMQKMQHWMCHHLYPGYDAETSMRILERLGKKRVIQNHMKRLRNEAKDVERCDTMNFNSDANIVPMEDIDNDFS